ncbi:MAG: polyphosphate kinase 1 [Leadbetterella sp.]
MPSVSEGVISFFKELLDFSGSHSEYSYNPNTKDEKSDSNVEKSEFISRDLSWLRFNERVLDQVIKPDKTVFERLRFLGITASNLDEFLTVRVGSLYNYLDFDKERQDYSGLRESQFRKVLLNQIKKFIDAQNQVYKEYVYPFFSDFDFEIIKYESLSDEQHEVASAFFENTVFPMLTPMVFDHTHAFPVLLPRNLILGVVSFDQQTTLFSETEENKKLSFVQIPNNLPKFFEFESENGKLLFLPIEELVRNHIQKLYVNVNIESVDLFRIIRNGDFVLDENDDVDADFIDEIKEKIRSRQAGRVVALMIENSPSDYLMDILKKKWEIDKYNIHVNSELMDFTRLNQIANHAEFKIHHTPSPSPILPYKFNKDISIFDTIKEQDVLLHHPYNNFEPVLHLIEKAAEDPNVLSIKLTIYRLAKNSRITQALLKAAQNGKHISVLFEIKARFDEENNIKEAEKLQKAGCFVIYGIGWLKTHTKLMLIVRKEGNKVLQYAHMATGNYNEDTSRHYTDVGLLTANPDYTRDISEFFNAITGHSLPDSYKNLITSPKQMRNSLIEMIRKESVHALEGKKGAICWKANSLEDKEIIQELYKASQNGVKVELIVRGICCLRPGRIGLSENISVRSIVGNLLEHARILYFHNDGVPRVFAGSADIMVRSFEKRIESIFEIINSDVRTQLIHILYANLHDNVNAYQLKENGEYSRVADSEGASLNIHTYFYDEAKSYEFNNKVLF